MGRYIVRRLIVALPTLFVVTVVVTGMIRIYPADLVVGWYFNQPGYWTPGLSEEELRAAYGLDKSFPRAYVEWVASAVRGDLGTSAWSDHEVSAVIFRRLRVSAPLALMAIAVAALVAVPLGVWSAVRHGGWQDYLARAVSVTGLSVPDFFLATLVLYVLSAAIGWRPDFESMRWWEHPSIGLTALVLAALIVGWRIGAITARMTRSAVLDVLQQDYVRTARAKGLTEQSVVVRHALRNALLPVLTIMGMQLPALLGGLVVIEVVFGLPGLGTLGFEAVQLRDYPMVQGVVFCAALCVIASNLVIDVASAAMDPRIRYA